MSTPATSTSSTLPEKHGGRRWWKVRADQIRPFIVHPGQPLDPDTDYMSLPGGCFLALVPDYFDLVSQPDEPIP